MALAIAVAIAPVTARAEDGGAQGDAAITAENPAHPAGIADRPNEAPGGTGLAALPGESVPPHAQVTAQGMTGDGAEGRSMAFSASGGECRDTIPGGPILAAAYALILLMFAGYALVLGKKNAALGAKIDELEKLLAKRATEKEPKGA
ncbi:MAG: hypothetical protein U0269_21975 [Polyangiales bacterium]